MNGSPRAAVAQLKASNNVVQGRTIRMTMFNLAERVFIALVPGEDLQDP